jgi:hypothetical protein
MENHLWHNERNGTFKETALLAGVAFSEAGAAAAAMAVEVGDYDSSGRLDILVPDMNGGCLYRNLDGGLFEDESVRSGISLAMSRRHGWGAAWADLDLDGDLDAFISAGSASRLEPQESQLFISDGRGRFQPSACTAGGKPLPKFVSRGVARGDYDGDGDLDLLVNNLNARPMLLRNDTPRRGRHWLMVELRGLEGSGDPIGALVTVTAGGKTQVQPFLSAGSYLSQHDHRLHFGLGPHDRAERVEVIWPDGARQDLKDVRADQRLVLRNPGPAPPRAR